VATLTARVGYRPAGHDLHGRICRESYHVVLTDGPLQIGVITRGRGEALCGATPLGECPPGLFEPEISCAACLTLAAREGISLEGES
jgi:hypothetical protein